jgi:hypothetical protein
VFLPFLTTRPPSRGFIIFPALPFDFHSFVSSRLVFCFRTFSPFATIAITMPVQGVMNKLKQGLWQGNGPNYERVDLEDGFEKEHTNKRSSRHAKPVIVILGFLLAIFLFMSSVCDFASFSSLQPTKSNNTGWS